MARKVVWARVESGVRQDVANGASAQQIARKYRFPSTDAARKACDRNGIKFQQDRPTGLNSTLRRKLGAEARKRGMSRVILVGQILAIVAHDDLFEAVLGPARDRA